MNVALTPSGRPAEDMDLGAATAQARQFLSDRGHTQTDNEACRVIRQLLHYQDAAVSESRGRLLFDRNLVADIMRNPMKHRMTVIACQAALVQGTLGVDTPMSAETVEHRRPRDPVSQNGGD